MTGMRGRAAVAVLALAAVAGGVTGWALRGDGGGSVPEGRTVPSVSVAAQGGASIPVRLDGRVVEGGDDFVLLDVEGGGGPGAVVRIEHVSWRAARGVTRVVPPPHGMVVCALVHVSAAHARTWFFPSGVVVEGARCAGRRSNGESDG
jgi:hypothetical protein